MRAKSLRRMYVCFLFPKKIGFQLYQVSYCFYIIKCEKNKNLFSLSLSSFLLFFQVSQKRYIKNTSFYIYILCGLFFSVIFFAFLILVEDVRWENNLMFQTPRPFIYLQCSSKLYFLLQ